MPFTPSCCRARSCTLCVPFLDSPLAPADLKHASQGVSDTPAWIVVKANAYARQHGKTPFIIYQGAWSILERDFEREIIPMARSEGKRVLSSSLFGTDSSMGYAGMALAPWNVLAGGKIRTDAEEQKRKQTGEKGRQILSTEWERMPNERKVCAALEQVATEVGAKNITAGELNVTGS